jgi:hypothetical protein
MKKSTLKNENLMVLQHGLRLEKTWGQTRQPAHPVCGVTPTGVGRYPLALAFPLADPFDDPINNKGMDCMHRSWWLKCD